MNRVQSGSAPDTPGGTGTAVGDCGGDQNAERTRRKPNKPLLGALLVLHVVMATLTWRDLRSRTEDEVRGKKSMWRVAALLNSGNSLAYFLIGRKQKPAG